MLHMEVQRVNLFEKHCLQLPEESPWTKLSFVAYREACNA